MKSTSVKVVLQALIFDTIANQNDPLDDRPDYILEIFGKDLRQGSWADVSNKQQGPTPGSQW